MKTYVVTGGAGFIGSHLVDALLNAKHIVYCIDNLVTGSQDNLKFAQQNKNFFFIEADVTEKIPDVGQFDGIFHLASPASVIDYQNYPEETARANSIGTIHALEMAKQYHAKLLFTSTSEVYGDPKEHPQKETYWGNVNPNGIRSCYDESKRFGEAMTMVYVRKHHLDARIVRIFNTYGPRMRKTDGRVVSNFINQALDGVPLTVYGDGAQTRSFCFISDLVKGILASMEHPGLAGEVINLGNPEEYTMLQLAQKIIEMTGSNSVIEYKNLPADDPVQRRPDIGRAKGLLGWEPSIPIDQGLAETIAYYRSS